MAVVGVGVYTLLPNSTTNSDNPLQNLASQAKVSATNTAINTSGIKTKVAQTLSKKREHIAAATGMTPTQVDNALSQLDIEKWQATSLPSDLSKKNTLQGTYDGVKATVTTYNDPSYVTVSALGQDITLKVPPSAQSYVSLLTYASS